MVALVLGFLLGEHLGAKFPGRSIEISGGNLGILVQSSIAKTLAITTLALFSFTIYGQNKRKNQIF